MSNYSQYLHFTRFRQIDQNDASYDYEQQLHVTFLQSNSSEPDAFFLDACFMGKSFLNNLFCTALPEAEGAAKPQDKPAEEQGVEQAERKRKDRRKTTSILYPQMTKNKRSECLKGPKSETQNMGKHLKSLTAAFLKVLINARILTAQESVSVSLFNKSNGGHSDFHELFRNPRLSGKCLEYFSSKDFVVSIMRSPKMTMRNKLIMVRHLEVLRSASYKHLTSWKIEV